MLKLACKQGPYSHVSGRSSPTSSIWHSSQRAFNFVSSSAHTGSRNHTKSIWIVKEQTCCMFGLEKVWTCHFLSLQELSKCLLTLALRELDRLMRQSLSIASAYKTFRVRIRTLQRLKGRLSTVYNNTWLQCAESTKVTRNNGQGLHECWNLPRLWSRSMELAWLRSRRQADVILFFFLLSYNTCATISRFKEVYLWGL